MKTFIRTLFALTLLVGTISCDAIHTAATNKVTSQGSPYEIAVICNQPEWNSELGDTIRTVLTSFIPYLNQEEQTFDIVRVTNQSYTGLIAKHRNIFEINVQPSITTPSIAVRYDAAAAPQVILTLQAPTIESATAYLSEHRESVVKGFEMAERDRAVEYAKKYSVAGIDKSIFETFGVEMKVPQGFSLRQQSDDMIWISYEYPIASQGAFIYSYPADLGINSLSEENLVEARNKFAKRIPGPSDGSYMTTYTEAPQQYRVLRIEGRLWIEMRGFWDVVNDFMGGPYVSYTTIDEATNSVFTIDCYVYSPKYGKRNYLRTLEHMVYNTKFPSTETK